MIYLIMCVLSINRIGASIGRRESMRSSGRCSPLEIFYFSVRHFCLYCFTTFSAHSGHTSIVNTQMRFIAVKDFPRIYPRSIFSRLRRTYLLARCAHFYLLLRYLLYASTGTNLNDMHLGAAFAVLKYGRIPFFDARDMTADQRIEENAFCCAMRHDERLWRGNASLQTDMNRHTHVLSFATACVDTHRRYAE